MEKTIATRLGVEVSEPLSFFIKSVALLLTSGVILFVMLAADYPAIHDALHNVRHALAVIPCH